jgi:chromosome segregation protein
MHLKKLQLYGFKSFADKTEFLFEPGITAIVGPNGCGKSNIADGIKWVLGEQSAKSLRGLQMQDVIFNGTTDKEPINFAEVSLTLSNYSKLLPIDYEEVTIARRLFRSGESEYLLNKTTVRLKDIMELMMGTGIGVDNYFIMEQGKIDMVLSSKPEDRRAIFEEASGITKYKSKKREAMNKLQLTEANLLRLNDIIAEVQRQLNSIERQAAKARRYQKHFEHLKELELKVSSVEHEDLQKQRDKIEQQVSSLKQKQAQVAVDVERLLGELKTLRTELEAVDVAMSQAKNDSGQIDNQMFRAKERIDLNQERIRELESAIVDLTDQLESSAAKKEDLKNRIEQLKNEKDSFSAERDSKGKAFQEKQDSLACLEKSIEEAQQTINRSKVDVLEKTAGCSKAKNELAKVAANIAACANRLNRLNLEKQGCLANLTGAKEALDDADAALNEQAQRLQSLGSESQALDQALKEAQGRVDSLNSDYDAAAKELTIAQSRVILSRDILEKHEGFSDSVSGFLSDPDIKAKPWYDDISDVLTALVAYSENKSEVSSLQARLGRLAADKEAASGTVAELAANLKGLTEQIIKEQIDLANKQSAKDRAAESFAKLKDDLSVVEAELDELTEESGRLRQQEDSLKAKTTALENDLSQLDMLINSNQDWIQLNLKEKEAALVEVAKTKAEIDSLSQRFDGLQVSLNVLVETSNREDALYQSRQKQTEDSRARIETLKSEIQKLVSGLEALADKKVSVEKELQDIVGNKSAVGARISQKQNAYEDLQKVLQEISSQTYSLESQAAQISFQQQRIKDRVSQTYKVDLGSYKLIIQRDVEMPQPEAEFNIDTARAEIEQLREKLDSIGPVNLDAMGEETQLKERFDLMVSQKEDLLKAKDSLLEAIAKINKTTKDMFLDTFNKVGEEFRHFFKMFFGGGDTELFLVDEQDVLESGIEIVARPPGKRLQNISLLSGGEKTMTALALLFAVFKVKPSPFCIMDEMDAPLDEANVDRFSRVLHEFTRDSQFIIITHNKKTITIADVIYGITMEESGISKVVSVRFGEGGKDKAVRQEAVGVS